jgi:hypothetical protein
VDAWMPCERLGLAYEAVGAKGKSCGYCIQLFRKKWEIGGVWRRERSRTSSESVMDRWEDGGCRGDSGKQDI